MAVDTAAEVLEQGELHGCEGQVSRGEGGVAVPELTGVVLEFLQGEPGYVLACFGAFGRFDHHLGILL